MDTDELYTKTNEFTINKFIFKENKLTFLDGSSAVPIDGENVKARISDIQHPIFKKDINGAFETGYDPEISVSIWALGLVYDIDINKENNVLIPMTLTLQICPEPEAIQEKVEKPEEPG